MESAQERVSYILARVASEGTLLLDLALVALAEPLGAPLGALGILARGRGRRRAAPTGGRALLDDVGTLRALLDLLGTPGRALLVHDLRANPRERTTFAN